MTNWDTPAHAETELAADAERVGTVVGSRICESCGFNLIGQPTLREAHYGLIIARCPECATVASLNEYPPRTRRSRKQELAAESAWFALITILLIWSGWLMLGCVQGVASRASHPIEMELKSEWGATLLDALRNLTRPGGKVSGIPPDVVQAASNCQTWYLTSYAGMGLDDTQLISAMGVMRFPESWWLTQRHHIAGVVGNSTWHELRLVPLREWFSEILEIGLLGVVLSGMLVHLRRRGRLLVIGLALAMAVAICMHEWPDPFAPAGPFSFASLLGAGYAAKQAALAQVWPSSMLIGLPVGLASLSLGLFFGRPLLRLLIRVLLPPSARSTLAVLWTCDGLGPPKPDNW